MKFVTIYRACFIAVIILGSTIPEAAAKLPYRQMAVITLDCLKITNKRRADQCRRKAMDPIHALCGRLRANKKTICYQRHTQRLQTEATNEIQRRKKKNRNLIKKKKKKNKKQIKENKRIMKK